MPFPNVSVRVVLFPNLVPEVIYSPEAFDVGRSDSLLSSSG